MAQIIGQSGRYVANVARIKKTQILTVAILAVGLVSVIEGIVIANCLPALFFTGWLRVDIFFLLFFLVIWVNQLTMNKINGLEIEQKKYESGARGENIVSKILSNFPTEYYVINDLKTDYGNLDHVVIGPTGVFIIDSKNWRGIVTANDKGEILLNEKPTSKQEIKSFTVRVMEIREQIITLAKTHELYFQGVFAFTSACVDAKWGKTGNVHCMREDQLNSYIVGKDFGTKLKPEQVKMIARAFAQLAHMEVDFTEKAKP